jgi:glutathione S-transferase
MTSVSEKATVPVLLLSDGKVIDESLGIMYWALGQNDPQDLLSIDCQEEISRLIQINDFQFKPKLDKYKYAVRFPEKTAQEYRDESQFFLIDLDNRLRSNNYLLGKTLSLADIAIFPFIRQFASVDLDWFESAEYVFLRNWLKACVGSAEFQRVMKKYLPWKRDQAPVVVYL